MFDLMLLGATDFTSSVPFQVGILVTALGAVCSGRIVVPRVWLDAEKENTKYERARADRLEEEVRRINATNMEKTIPALEGATSTVREVTLVLNEIAIKDRQDRR